MKLETQEWVDKAEGDLKVARREMQTSDPVCDAGLAHLQEFSALQELNLSGTDVSDVGLVNLEKLTRLQKLALSNTLITGAGLVHLQELTALQELDLSWNENFSDAELVHFPPDRSMGTL